VNLAAVEDLLIRVARLAADHPEIVEMDLNPVLARSDGAEAVDVRIRVR
jgi:acyl-CoA synthetase (NDP forming)